ncbi:hypothetical protein KJ693_02100 [bacterium]|nr:hypothetical protein [bacterium]
MSKTELLEIIRNGENSRVEFKRDDVQPDGLAKEIVEKNRRRIGDGEE